MSSVSPLRPRAHAEAPGDESVFAPALDLANSAARSGDGLGTPEELLAWLSAHGLDAPRLERLAASPAEASLLLREARRLREHVVRALEALSAGEEVPADAAYGIDRVLSERHVSARLRAAGDGLRLEEELRDASLLALLAPAALAAAELLTGADPGRVRRCAAPDCAAWLVDGSKAGRRRWCSMATCGNRAKAARHRRRHRAG